MENQEKKGRSNPGTEASPNPAKIFVEWKSKNEKFSFYDKEKKEDVLLKMPFNFIPLFICSTLKGYNHKKGKTYISNEVENISTDTLTVMSYDINTKAKKVEHKGLYADFKEDLDQNIKFTLSIYAAIKGKDGLTLINIQLNGAGLHHWFDFAKKNNIWKNAVSVKSTTDEKNGTVNYKAPVYSVIEVKEEDDIACGELQEQVKEYLNEYFAKNKSNTTKVDENQNNGLNSKSESKKESKKDAPIHNENNPLDDDLDLPF